MERGRERNRERDTKREREGWGMGKETEKERVTKITLGETAFAPKSKRKERLCAHEKERERLMANETKKHKQTPLSRAPDYNKITQPRFLLMQIQIFWCDAFIQNTGRSTELQKPLQAVAKTCHDRQKRLSLW